VERCRRALRDGGSAIVLHWRKTTGRLRAEALDDFYRTAPQRRSPTQDECQGYFAPTLTADVGIELPMPVTTSWRVSSHLISVMERETTGIDGKH